MCMKDFNDAMLAFDTVTLKQCTMFFSFYNFIFTTNTCQMVAIESIELDYQCLPIMHNFFYDKIIEYNCNSIITPSIESPYYNYDEFNNKVINAK